MFSMISKTDINLPIEVLIQNPSGQDGRQEIKYTETITIPLWRKKLVNLEKKIKIKVRNKKI